MKNHVPAVGRCCLILLMLTALLTSCSMGSSSSGATSAKPSTTTVVAPDLPLPSDEDHPTASSPALSATARETLLTSTSSSADGLGEDAGEAGEPVGGGAGGAEEGADHLPAVEAEEPGGVDDDADMNRRAQPFWGLGSSVVCLRNGAGVLGQALDAFHAE